MAVKRPMRKVVWVLVVLLRIVIVGGVGLALALNSVVKAGIEEGGPTVVRVPMKVRDVDVSLLGGYFALEGFEVGNPSGFSSEHSLAVGRVRVEAELRSLMRDEIVMPLIEVEKPNVTLEFAGGKTNLGEIQRNLARPERDTSGEPRKKLRIGVIRVRRATVTVTGLPDTVTLPISLPDIEIRDIKAGGEAAGPAEVAARTLDALYRSILREGQPAPSSERLDALKRAMEDALPAARRDLGEGGEELDKAAEQVKKRLESILE